MPGRQITFSNKGVYHIFSRTIDNKRIFIDPKLCQLFLDLLLYYRSTKPTISYADFRKLKAMAKKEKAQELHIAKYFQNEILCYCLMPNHYHLLVRQKIDYGISKHMSDLLNAFTRYYNVKYQRFGGIFARFKATQIYTTEQLAHVSRYIHLNPCTAQLVAKDQLATYAWSSLRHYVKAQQRDQRLISSQFLLKLFGTDNNRYQEFVYGNADYQRRLHLMRKREKR